MLLSFRYNDYFVQVLFMSRTTVFYKANQRPTSHTQLKKQLLHKDVSIQRRRKPCYQWSWNSRSKAYLVTLAKIQDTPAREVARSHSSCILSFDLIGQHQNKRLYVTEIVLPLGFADAIFRKERNDDRKCVCCSQATFIRPVLNIEWAQFVLQNCEKLHSVLGLYDNKTVPHGTVYLKSDV